MNPNPPPPDIPNLTRIMSFKSSVQNMASYSTQQLQSFLESPETASFFKYTLSDLFPETEVNPLALFQEPKFKHFSFKETPLSKDLIDFIIEASKILKISCQLLFYYLDLLIKDQGSLSLFNSAAHLQSNKEAIFERLHNTNNQVKLQYIKCIYELFRAPFQELDESKRVILEKFIFKVNQDNQFLKVLIENLAVPEFNKISQFNLQRIDSYVFRTLQEKVFFEQIILLICSNGFLAEPRSQIACTLLKMFYEQ